jgi:hypothetical protein
MNVIRTLILIVMLLLAAVLLSGCRFTVGHQDLMLRPATRIPARSVEQGDGEQIMWEEMDPEGSSMFVFLRGSL